MFKAETRLEQAREVRMLIRKLPDLVPVAVCSGNLFGGNPAEKLIGFFFSLSIDVPFLCRRTGQYQP